MWRTRSSKVFVSGIFFTSQRVYGVWKPTSVGQRVFWLGVLGRVPCRFPFVIRVMLNCRFGYDTCLMHYSFLFQEVFIVMASRGGPRFVGEKSTVCRVKVSSFSRGFCVPGARGFLDFFCE